MMTKDEIAKISERARAWALVNAPDQYHYFSTAAWVGSAHNAGIITRVEYDALRADYGESFWYTGD